MSATLQIEFSSDARALMERIADRPGLLRAMSREIDKQLQLTVGHISTVRMTGNNGKPFPVSDHKLGVRSAHLRRSIRATKATISGDTITASIGSNIRYAGVHEFGATIKRVQLAGSVRLATDRRGNLLRQGKNGKLAVFARKSRKSVQTVAYAGGKRYEITIPARAPFRFGIQDRQTETINAVSRAIFNFYKGGKQ